MDFPAAITESLREARRRTISLVDDLNDEQMMGPRLEIVNAAYFLSLALLHEDMTDNIKKCSARESTSHKIRSMQF